MPAELVVNGVPANDPTIWLTGGVQTWARDLSTVQLKAEANTISLQPPAVPLIDHLNVMDAGY